MRWLFSNLHVLVLSAELGQSASVLVVLSLLRVRLVVRCGRRWVAKVSVFARVVLDEYSGVVGDGPYLFPLLERPEIRGCDVDDVKHLELPKWNE